MASHLLKMTHFLYDVEGYKTKLYFLRAIEGREVDFLVTVDKNPWFAVEVKSSRGKVSSSLKYFQKKLKIPFVYQVINQSGVDYIEDNIRTISVGKFLSGLV